MNLAAVTLSTVALVGVTVFLTVEKLGDTFVRQGYGLSFPLVVAVAASPSKAAAAEEAILQGLAQRPSVTSGPSALVVAVSSAVASTSIRAVAAVVVGAPLLRVGYFLGVPRHVRTSSY